MISGRLLVLGTLFVSLVACAGRSDDSQSQTSRLDEEGTVEQPTATTKDFTLSLNSDSPVVGLGETLDLDVTVTPAKGFTGDVDLSVAGLSTGVTAAPVRVTLDGTSVAAQTKVTLTSAYTAYVTPKDTTVPITVTGTSGKSQATAVANFKVAPRLTLYIPKDISLLYSAPGGPLRAEWGAAFGPDNQPLRTQPGNGIVITIFNNDTKAHIIHGPGGSFPHGDFNSPVQPGAFEILNGNVRTRTMNVGDTAQGYVHGEPNSQNAAFKIRVAATE